MCGQVVNEAESLGCLTLKTKAARFLRNVGKYSRNRNNVKFQKICVFSTAVKTSNLAFLARALTQYLSVKCLILWSDIPN